MDASTLVARLEAATASFRNLERQLADPDVAEKQKRQKSYTKKNTQKKK